VKTHGQMKVLETSRPKGRPRPRRTATACIGAGLVIAAAACGSNAASPSSSGTTGAQVAGPSSKGSFTWEVVTTLTGPDVPLLADQQQGIKLAVQQINAAGGVKGHQVNVNMVDDAGTPQGAIQAYDEVIGNAVFVQTAVTANSVTAMLPVANKSGVVITSGAISDSSLVSGNRPNVFTEWPDASSSMAPYVSLFMKDNPSVKKVAVVEETDDTASESQGGLLINAAKSAGLQVGAPIAVTSTQTDFTSVVNKIQDQKPDAVLLAVEAPITADILIQMGRDGMGSMPKIGPRVAWNPAVVPEIAGTSGLANFWTMEFFSPSETSEAAKFVKAYQNEFKVAPTDAAAFAYEAVYVVADNLTTAEVDGTGTLASRRSALSKTLNDLSGYTSALGIPTSYHDGVAVKPAFALHGNSSGILTSTPLSQ
jgi:branched-chain amino acid transport system substrate-binding protein